MTLGLGCFSNLRQFILTTSYSTMRTLLAAALLGFCLLPELSMASEKDGQPYRVTVWANVLFDTAGVAKEIEIADESNFSAQFLGNVRQRLSSARIQPPNEDGASATLKTGVQLVFVITPSENGGSAKIVKLQMSPLPTQTYLASYPKDVRRTGGWEGAVSAICTVGTDGTCAAINVKALPGMPESVRRFAKASLEGWHFQPQEVNGKPVVGEYELSLKLMTKDSAPEDFRQPKFERILKTR